MKFKRLSNGEKRLLAEFVANIGVAWFAAGVIGLFAGGKSSVQVIFSLSWGMLFTVIFLRVALALIKGVK